MASASWNCDARALSGRGRCGPPGGARGPTPPLLTPPPPLWPCARPTRPSAEPRQAAASASGPSTPLLSNLVIGGANSAAASAGGGAVASAAGAAASALPGPAAAVAEVWVRALLDVALPIAGIWLLVQALERTAPDLKKGFEERMAAGEESLGAVLGNRKTVLSLLLLSLRAPASALLPPLLAAYAAKGCLGLLDYAVAQGLLLPSFFGTTAANLAAQLAPLGRALSAGLDAGGTLFAAWFFIQIKDSLVSEAILVRAVRSGRSELQRVLLPLSSLLTWAVVLATGVSILQSSFGLDLKPLLALGGVGGIAAGFASQQILQNLVSGVTIFLSRPFVVGERVVLSSGGGQDISGAVESVEILRTQLRTREGVLVALPNKLVMDMVVYNLSRGPASEQVAPEGADGAAAAPTPAPVLWPLTFVIKVGRDQEHLLEDIRDSVTRCLAEVAEEERLEATAALAAVAMLPPEEAEATGSQAASPTASADDDTGHAADSGARAGGNGPADSDSKAASGRAKAQAGRSPGGGGGGDEARAGAAAGGGAAGEEEEGEGEGEEQEKPGPPPVVSVTLRKLGDDAVELFVRCELLLAAARPGDAERRCDAALLRASRLVAQEFGGRVLKEPHMF